MHVFHNFLQKPPLPLFFLDYNVCFYYFSAFYRYILLANEDRGHYVHFMNLDRPGLIPGQRMLLATVTDVESRRVEKLSNAKVKAEVFSILQKFYANATMPSGKLK